MRRMGSIGTVAVLVLGGALGGGGAVAGGAVGVAAAGVTAAAGTAATTGAAMPFDFDGDHRQDLVVAIPEEDVGSVRDAGAVQILYGSVTRPTARDQFVHQDRLGILDRAEVGDRFGQVVASGDFDGDGYADLAVGIPMEDLAGMEDAGAVQVVHGGPGGLTTRDRLWHQDSPGIPGGNSANSMFGAALAVGDFDSDGFDDLAIGAWHKKIGGLPRGRVIVVHGSAAGLTGQRVRWWDPRTLSLPNLWFGNALVVGDFDGDGNEDLGIASGEGVGWEWGPWRMFVFTGTPSGLTARGARSIEADDVTSDFFGPVAGDFDADGRDDLAISALGGTLTVIPSGAGGLDPARAQVLECGMPPEMPVFGGKATGDLTGDGVDDLVVQAPTSMIEPYSSGGGGVCVFAGSPSGLHAVGPLLTQDVAGIPGVGEPGDDFGRSLAILRGRPTGPGWLAVGVPRESLGRVRDAGRMVAIPGSPSGVRAYAATQWHQDLPGILDRAEAGDRFGASADALQPVP